MAGSGLLLGSGVVLMAATTWVVLLNLAQRGVTWPPFLASALGFVLSFSIVLLVPFDVGEAREQQLWAAQHGSGSTAVAVAAAPGRMLDERVVAFLYWSTFALCWCLCPVLLEYEAAGDFTPLARMRATVCRSTSRWKRFMAATAALLVWLAVSSGGRGDLGAWCVACSNAWGLTCASLLLGYGFVALPRHLWRLADPGSHLETLYQATVAVDEAKTAAQFELQDVMTEALGEVSVRGSQDWDPKLENAFAQLQLTLEECDELQLELTRGVRLPPRDGGGNGDAAHRAISVPHAGDDGRRVECLRVLHRALKQAALEARRTSCRWNEHIEWCLLLENLEQQLFPSAAELISSWPLSWLVCRSPMARSFFHGVLVLWLRLLRPVALRISGVLCGCLSVAIVLGQLAMFSKNSPLPMLLDESHSLGLTQAVCMLPLAYVVYAAYWSIFRLKFAGWYGLYPNHNTDASSLLWCAATLARLVPPLCYNFVLLVRADGSSLQRVMGRMEDVPVLGGTSNRIFPVLVGLFCVCNLLNFYTKLVQIFGLATLEPESPGSVGSEEPCHLLMEGQRLVERERRHRFEERNLLEMHDKRDPNQAIPLRLQISYMIEEGTLPADWNASCP